MMITLEEGGLDARPEREGAAEWHARREDPYADCEQMQIVYAARSRQTATGVQIFSLASGMRFAQRQGSRIASGSRGTAASTSLARSGGRGPFAKRARFSRI